MLEEPLLLLLRFAALGDVLDCQKNHAAVATVVADGESVKVDRALAQLREGLFKLEALDGGMLRNDARQQLPQARYVPLTIREVEQGPAVRLRRIFAEHFVEATTAGEEVKRVVKDE